MTSACHAEDHGFESRTDRHFFGSIAQSVEQRTENPCVTGSIPVGATRLIGNSNFYKFESNKLLTEMLVFLLFKKGKVMSYDNRN